LAGHSIGKPEHHQTVLLAVLRALAKIGVFGLLRICSVEHSTPHRPSSLSAYEIGRLDGQAERTERKTALKPRNMTAGPT
jgi:hypothetical protein